MKNPKLFDWDRFTETNLSQTSSPGRFVPIKKAIFNGGVFLYGLREIDTVADQYSFILIYGGMPLKRTIVIDEMLLNGCEVVNISKNFCLLKNPRNSLICFSHRTGDLCINTSYHYLMAGKKGVLS